MPTIKFVKQKQEIEIPEGSNLREEAKKAGISVYAGPSKVLHCPGMGMCGTCRVLVKAGMENLSDKTVKEKINLNTVSLLAALGNEEEIRLSCQVQVNGDCSIVTTPEFNWSGENFWQKPYPNK